MTINELISDFANADYIMVKPDGYNSRELPVGSDDKGYYILWNDNKVYDLTELKDECKFVSVEFTLEF